tara:strand:- start:2075 stop:3247 length:1173 start_codon:yes stop_codon:yes gene_type:complete
MNIRLVGAGISGLACATELATLGHSVTIHEASSSLDDIGAGIQLSPNAMHVLADYGLKEEILDLGSEPEKIIFQSHNSLQPLLKIDIKKISNNNYQNHYIHIHRADLIKTLYTKAVSLGVRVRFNSKGLDFKHENDCIELRLSNNESKTCDLLIAADGVKSLFRNKIASSNKRFFSGKVAWRCLIEPKEYVKSFSLNHAYAFLGPKNHLVAYPIRNNQLINIVAITSAKEWIEEEWSIPGTKEELLKNFLDWHPKINHLIDSCSEVHKWGLFDHEQLNVWSFKNLVLLGDACHPMLPFMAQGGAAGIESGFILAKLIDKHQDNLNLAFTSYKEMRDKRTFYLQNVSRSNGIIFHLHPIFRWLVFKWASIFPFIIENRNKRVFNFNPLKEF